MPHDLNTVLYARMLVYQQLLTTLGVDSVISSMLKIIISASYNGPATSTLLPALVSWKASTSR